MSADPLPIRRREPGYSATRALESRWREVARFLIVGTTNTLIAYALYLLLLLFLPYLAAYSASYVFGIFVSYYLNAKFVFREQLRLSKALQYPLAYVVQYLLGAAMLYLLVELLQLSQVVAPFVVALLMIPVAYRLSRYIIKRQPRGAVAGSGLGSSP